MATIFATFSDSDMAEKATGALLDHGARREDISLIASYKEPIPETDAGVNERVAVEMETEHTDVTNLDDGLPLAAKTGLSTTTAGDAASGAAKGAAIGLGAGVLAALAALALPGIGIVAGGGALAMAIAGAAGTTAAGAVAGGVTGYLKDQGVPDEAAVHYNESFMNGGAILSVTVPSGGLSSNEAGEVLGKYGAIKVGTYDAVSV